MTRKERIEACLNTLLRPELISLTDESHMHAVPAGAESHFRLVIVSSHFDGQALLARHRRLQGLLRDEFANGLHALAMHAYTPGEWQARGQHAPESPKCRGGGKARISAPQAAAALV